MGWINALVCPLKNLWSHCKRPFKRSRGIYMLYEDVKSCECEDVQALWSMVVTRSHRPHPPPQNTRLLPLRR
ncbi:hypothetical protein V2J09_022083 [Rumex salicifolius]